MIETRPQFTYSPEGILQVVTGLDEHYTSERIEPEIDAKILERKKSLVDAMGETEGIEATEEKGVATINIDIEKKFGFRRYADDTDEAVEDFVSQLGRILPFHPIDGVDRVVGLEYLGNNGANGVIYHQFQRYLNSNAVSEEALGHAAQAMAVPFGDDVIDSVRKGLQFFDFGESIGVDGFSSRIHITPTEFGLFVSKKNGYQLTETTGSVNWRWLNISTLGSCACWGATGDERERGISIHEPSLRLYEMSPHNVDIARQSLSLVLGVGGLAYYAAHYEGTDDVFASAAWNEPRVFQIPNE